MSDKNNQLNEYRCEVPVMLCTFTKLDTTKLVFEQIRKVRPPRLYLVSDGPRESHPEDKGKIEAVHDYIEGNIDWDCEVFKNYSDVNLGCGKRMPTGVSWVFEHEERAIFFEDDCVPEVTFFRYCEELLDKYENDDKVLLISGNNQIAYIDTFDGDYGFSHQANIWGWATWRRSWQEYDIDIKDWPESKHLPIWKQIYNRKAYWFLFAEYDTVYRHEYDAWDYQFSYLLGKKDAFCIIPKVNLVSNAGFDGNECTHTADMPKWMDQRSFPLEFPIKHPDNVIWSRKYDEEFSKRDFAPALTVHIKHLLGMDVNKSIFEK